MAKTKTADKAVNTTATVTAVNYKSPAQLVLKFLTELASRPIPKDGHKLNADELHLARVGYSQAARAVNADGSLKKNTPASQVYKTEAGLHGFVWWDNKGGVRYSLTLKPLKTYTKAYLGVRPIVTRASLADECPF